MEEALHKNLWKGESEVAQLILARKKDMEAGKVKFISLAEFKDELQQRIEAYRA